MSKRACMIALFCLVNTLCAAGSAPPQLLAESNTAAKPIDHQLDDMDVVLTVNGEPVVWREFRQIMMRHKAKIYSHFSSKYGIRDNADFWTTTHNGEKPLQMIKQRARNDIVRLKIHQIIARENGIIHDIRYKTFLEQWQRENNRRKQAIVHDHAVYGPKQYTESVYFNYIYENMLIRLKEKLGQGPLNLPQEKLRQLYERDKDKKYRKHDTVKVQKIIACWNSRSKTRNCSSKQEARKLIEQAKRRMDSGEDFDQVARSINADHQLHEQTFNHENAMAEVMKYPSFFEQALLLDVGHSSGIIEEARMDMFVILKVVHRRIAGYMPFEEMRSFVRLRAIDQQYDDMVERRIKDADVTINKLTWGRIKTR